MNYQQCLLLRGPCREVLDCMSSPYIFRGELSILECMRSHISIFRLVGQMMFFLGYLFLVLFFHRQGWLLCSL